MSRSGYSEDYDDELSLGRWRGQVSSVIRSKKGQAFLRELVEALDAMPVKRLISHELRVPLGPQRDRDFIQGGGDVCALGALGARRGIALEALDTEDYDTIADTFGIKHQLVQEIEFMNDEASYCATPESRWHSMRAWAMGELRRSDPIVRKA